MTRAKQMIKKILPSKTISDPVIHVSWLYKVTLRSEKLFYMSTPHHQGHRADGARRGERVSLRLLRGQKEQRLQVGVVPQRQAGASKASGRLLFQLFVGNASDA